MKPLLLVLLAASLVANVVLGLQARHSSANGSESAAVTASAGSLGTPPATGATGNAENKRTLSGGSPKAPGAVTGAVWSGVAKTEQDLHRVVADLRAAGYPPEIIRAVINELLKQHFAGRDPNAGQPFWKRSTPNAETMAAQVALSNERRTLFESLLGPDARPSAMMDDDSRERRYGSPPNDKIDAIARIERDYSEMSAEAWAKRRGNAITNMEATMQTQQLMEEEKRADLAAVLSPEELAQYEMRTSNTARSLMNNLRNIDITEAEYARLYQAQKIYTAANPMRATMDAAAFAQRQQSQLSLNNEVRSVLGDARFYTYLEGADRNYASVAQVMAKYPAVTPAATYQAYQLQVELQGAVSQIARGGRLTPEQSAELRTTVESYNTRLESLIGTEAANAYRSQGMGRVFSSFRNIPTPAQPAK
jgi:hypothetical protein